MIHAPVGPCFGNWLYWQGRRPGPQRVPVAAHPGPAPDVRRARGKRLRLTFLNVPARLARTARRLHLRFPAAYRHARAFAHALRTVQDLPAFG
jgi:hypothetical protein